MFARGIIRKRSSLAVAATLAVMFACAWMLLWAGVITCGRLIAFF